MSTAGLRLRAAARRARPLGLALIPAATGWLVACGNVQVRPLATGVQDRPAYALAGPSLDGLRDEARRLCPAGADVLRSAQRVDGGHAVQETPAGWYGSWWQKSQTMLAPARAEAQLVVLCQPVQGVSTLAALPPASLQPARTAAADAAGAADTDPSAGRRSAAPGPSVAPVGEGDLRGAASAPRQGRQEIPTAAAPSGGRTADLSGGLTAALPTAAVSSGRPGRAPSAAAVPGQARGGPAAAAAAGQVPAAKAQTATRPANPASSPILTY